MLTLHHIDYSIGARTLYDDLNWQISAGDKVGLIGYNGMGKSTLLRIITGQLQPDKGRVQQSKDYHIGFLTQDSLSGYEETSIYEIALSGFAEIHGLQKQIDSLLTKLEQESSSELLEELADLQDAFGQAGGYNVGYEVEKVLGGIGFAAEVMHNPLSSFSGGWRMRVLLAKLLLARPDLLLLDEPTNHLDIVATKWLERYLAAYSSAVVIVSHDRHFLDQVTTKTAALTNGKLQCYSGNYTFYEKEKVRLEEIAQQTYDNQQKEIARTSRFIDRFRSKASKAKQVQSRVKALEKLTITPPPQDIASKVRIAFGEIPKANRVVASVQKIYKAYDDNIIFADASATIHEGDKIALIGANGKGKSTLLHMLSGRVAADDGTIMIGSKVKYGFYAQHQLELLNPQHTVYEALRAEAGHKSETALRTTLGTFLFSKDDVFKKVAVLSGGERARLALAKLFLTESNFLLLDEPTNHLDITTINLLASALRAYPGSYLLVSHDRHFIAQTADHLWHIQEGQLKDNGEVLLQ
jgi:ATP-binding cassette subfamily F protein 3